MNTETNNLPVKIKEQIQSSGMTNLSRAQEIAINYAPYLQQIDEQAEIVKGLKKGNPEHVTIAKRARLDIGKICSAVGERKKEDKQTILIAGRFIDGLYNTVNGAGRLTQGEAKEIEDHAEMIEKAKKDKLRAKREKEISEFDVNPGTGDIADMSDEVWKYYIDGLKNDRDIRVAEEEKAEREKIEAQKKQDLFYARRKKLIQFSQFNIQNELTIETTEKDFIAIVEKGEKLKAEFQADQKRIKAENEKLKKEREEKIIADEKAEIERQRLAKIEQDKRDKIEQERQAKAKIEREEKEQIWKELKAKSEAERKRKQAEVDRTKSEAEAKRKAELAPDKERMTKWIADMTIIDIVNDRMSKESVLMASEIIDKFNAFKKWATEKVNEIK